MSLFFVPDIQITEGGCLMQTEGKDLTRVRIKRFQKTHHVSCRCQQCKLAEEKKDPRLRGMLEDGFKVYLDKTRE